MNKEQLPEMLPVEDREWAYELFKKYGGEKSFSLWVDMVQVAGVETAWSNIVLMYEKRRRKPDAEFYRVMYTALMHHLEKQKQNN